MRKHLSPGLARVKIGRCRPTDGSLIVGLIAFSSSWKLIISHLPYINWSLSATSSTAYPETPFPFTTLCVSIRRRCLSELRSPTSRPLGWAPQFGRFEEDEAVAQNEDYKKGLIVPMDPSSFLAVQNMSIQPGDHVLDLCCAPGTKLVLMAEELGEADAPRGSLTGVDVSRARLGAAVAMIKKYKLADVRLFATDGRSFFVSPHLIYGRDCQRGLRFDEIYPKDGLRPFYSTSAYRKQRGSLASPALYDRVIVDAQCTHDGSVKHIRKHIENGWREFSESHYSASGLEHLYDLQYSLLSNGFKLLKPGGILVYSTCSLSPRQNEEIILRFMQEQVGGDRKVLDPIGPLEFQITFGERYRALRIMPTQEMGGGFFVCRLTKSPVR